jgi:uncharacterized protein YjeT (DUF2065 family)
MDQPLFEIPTDPAFLPAAVLVIVLAWIIFTLPDPPSIWRHLRGQLHQLGNELDRHIDRDRWGLRLPVFSAETIHRKEAEFIRERLPRKVPYMRLGLALLAMGVLLWWLAR